MTLRLAVCAASLAIGAPAQTDADLERRFTQTVRPFLATYCTSCHGATNPAAQLNLKQYATVADAARDHTHWALVPEKLSSGEMPPKGTKQPGEEERKAVIEWVETMRMHEAKKNAGDPGIVLVRRLSNAEYNNAVRDLTGVDLQPAREFPVDPSNASGFDNSGESLSMSPALLNKYLKAAREIASHLVLRPQGIAFAPHLMLAESDREKYTIQRIVEFYDRQPTDYADYFEAAWKYKHRAALGKTGATLTSVAAESKVSAKYLPMVWEMLEGTQEEIGPGAKLQAMWRRLPPPEAKQTALIRESCVKMRDYVVHIRKLTALQFRSPKVRGLAGTSQPLMNWKLRAYAANRRNFDKSALQVEGEPPMQMPVMVRTGGVPTEDEVGVRNAVIAARLRVGDPELFVPAGQRARYEEAFQRFSQVFPDAFYIRERGRFYPDDSEDKGRLLSAGFHNVMGYTRDDTPLQELILDDKGIAELEMLWLEFDTIADQTTRTYVQFYFNQSGEIEGRGRESGSFRTDIDVTTEKVIFGIRDTYLAKAQTAGDELAREAIREHFARVNAQIRKVEKARVDSEPTHLDAMEEFAAKAYRRALTDKEKQDLRAYYRDLREKNGLTHDDAIRDMVVLVLMSPDFCYRIEATGAERPQPVLTTQRAPRTRAAAKPAAEKTTPLSGYALASRLSFLLWSSLPDAELRRVAESGELQKPEVIRAQVKRMLQDPRARSLATEFAGNWLDFRRFEDHNSVDRTRFTTFTNELRQAMYEEPVRYIQDIIQNDRPVLDLIYGTHTFVNRPLATHYGMNDSVRVRGSDWVRVDDARRFGRGGLLPMAAFLTRNSPGLRTSPVKRGFWIAKTLLGESIPPPPPSVPELPTDESKTELPLRQMLAKHRELAACAGCHARFDGFGLAFEGYGPIGEQRTKDLAGRPIDSSAEFPGGTQGSSVDDLVAYIKAKREKDFVNGLARKLLVYALGRSLQLSDEPLVAEMKERFAAGGHKFSILIESVVESPQFRTQRNPEYLTSQGEARKGD